MNPIDSNDETPPGNTPAGFDGPGFDGPGEEAPSEEAPGEEAPGDETLLRSGFTSALERVAPDDATAGDPERLDRLLRRASAHRSLADLIGFAFAHLLRAALGVTSFALGAAMIRHEAEPEPDE